MSSPVEPPKLPELDATDQDLQARLDAVWEKSLQRQQRERIRRFGYGRYPGEELGDPPMRGLD